MQVLHLEYEARFKLKIYRPYYALLSKRPLTTQTKKAILVRNIRATIASNFGDKRPLFSEHPLRNSRIA